MKIVRTGRVFQEILKSYTEIKVYLDQSDFSLFVGDMNLTTSKGIAITDYNPTSDETFGNLAINIDLVQVFLAHTEQSEGEDLINLIKSLIEMREDYVYQYTDSNNQSYKNTYQGFYVNKPIDYLGKNEVILGNSSNAGANRYLFSLEFRIVVNLDSKLKGNRI